MELICAVVFVLLNLANASPYGYGVKGGSSAKAEAKAASGAFSGFVNPPINFPANGGYSASFSNSSSSSSSFASSSSSSSSSSFSISGTGAAGLAGTGINSISTSNLAGEGCGTGRCQQDKSNGIHESNDSLESGAGLQTSAGAIAQAGSYTGLQSQAPISCGGAKCPEQPTAACNGLNCPNNVETEKKCNFGSCRESSQNSVPSDDDSDDIPFVKVVTDQSKPDALNYNKPYGSNVAGNFNSGHYYPYYNAAGPATGYTGGFGGPSGILNTNGPSESGATNTAHTQSIANSATHDKTYSSGLSGPSGQTNTNAVAASGSSAETGSIIPQHNIPVYTGGFGGPSGILNTNGVSGSGATSTVDASSISNAASHVNGPTYNNGFSGPTGVIATTPIAVSTPSYGTLVTSKPNPTTPAYNNEPVYTGGFGGPSGILSVDSFTATELTTSKSPIIGANNKAPGYNNGNKGFLGSTIPNTISSTQSIPTSGVYVPPQPNLSVPTYSDSIPEYTVGFGGPLGISASGSGSTSTTDTQNIGTHNNIPTYTNGGGGSAAQIDTNTIAASGSSSSTGSFVSHNDHNIPVYTGGFGGPSGILSTDKTIGSGSAGTISTSNTANTITQHKTPNADGYGVFSGTINPNVISTAGQPSTSPFVVLKPNLIANVQNKEYAYTGGFGGPSGLLNPDDYTPPIKPALAQQRPPVKPAYPYDGSIAPSVSSQSYPVSGKPISCLSGVCGSQGGVSSNVASTAVASSNAVVYTGGFGGPSGILKPFDDGKINNMGHTDYKDSHGQLNSYYPSPSKIHSYSGLGGAAPSSANINTYYDSPTSEVHSSYENGGVSSQLPNNAQANSVAGASAGSFGSGIVGPGQYTKTGPCNQGCGHSNSDRDHNAYNFGTSNAFSSSKAGSWNALNINTNVADAEAKSVAGSYSGTDFGRFGLGKSFASSSASAHASAGAGIKGGYGR